MIHSYAQISLQSCVSRVKLECNHQQWVKANRLMCNKSQHLRILEFSNCIPFAWNLLNSFSTLPVLAVKKHLVYVPPLPLLALNFPKKNLFRSTLLFKIRSRLDQDLRKIISYLLKESRRSLRFFYSFSRFAKTVQDLCQTHDFFSLHNNILRLVKTFQNSSKRHVSVKESLRLETHWDPSTRDHFEVFPISVLLSGKDNFPVVNSVYPLLPYSFLNLWSSLANWWICLQSTHKITKNGFLPFQFCCD